MSLSILLPFWLVWAAGVAAPGPNFFAVSQMAAAHGRQAGLATAAGIALGAVFWAIVGLFGIKLIFSMFPWGWTLAKLVGSSYLIYIGFRLWNTASTNAETPPKSSSSAFLTGLLTNLSNPKTAAFAASLFAAALPEQASVSLTMAAFLIIVLTAWLWYSACALMISHARIRALYDRSRQLLTRVAGTIFIGFGVQLALED